MDSLAACPVCKSDRYLNPQLRLLVSPCLHKMCETCIGRLFTQGPSPCPLCKTILRKNQFVTQTYEDLSVEREIQVRQKVFKYFNKRLEDFQGNLRQYNDYLEEVEEIVFNLVNNVDVEATQEKIDKFRQENKELIQKNQSRQVKEDRVLAYKAEKEKKEKLLRKEAYLRVAQDQALSKEKEREALIEELAVADSSDKIKSIVARSASQAVASSTSVGTIQYAVDIPIVTLEDEEEYLEELALLEDEDMEDPFEVLYVPPYTLAPNYIDPWTQPWKEKKDKGDRGRGGGFLPSIVYAKSLTAAFSSILFGISTDEQATE